MLPPRGRSLSGFQQDLPRGCWHPCWGCWRREGHAAHGGWPRPCRDDVRPCLLEPAEAAAGGQPAPGAAAGLRRGLRGGDQPPVHPVHEGGSGGPQRGGEQHHRWALGCQPSRALLPRAGPWADVFHTPLPALFCPRLVPERILHQPQAAPSAAARAPRRREGGLTAARMRSGGRSQPSPGISRHTSPRARAQPPASPSCTTGERSALDVKNQIAFQNQADLFSIVRESTFSRDLVFVFFLTAHPAALHHGPGCTLGVSQLPDIFLAAAGAASVCLRHLLAGSGWGLCGCCCANPCLPAVPYTLHVLPASTGVEAGLRSSSRDELRDCHFLNKSVLDTPPGSGCLLPRCSAVLRSQGCLSWVTAGTALTFCFALTLWPWQG